MIKINGIGIDIVSISRIEKLYNQYKEKFTNKIFSQREIEEAIKKGHFYQTLSGKFSAKEAFIKAVNLKLLDLKEIEILSDENGKPFINYQDQQFTLISITHEKEYAAAIVIIFNN